MLCNDARVTAFTVSELLSENQHRGKEGAGLMLRRLGLKESFL